MSITSLQTGKSSLLCLACRRPEKLTQLRCRDCGRPCHTGCSCVCERPVPSDAPKAASRESLLRIAADTGTPGSLRAPGSGSKVPAEIPRPSPRTEVCESLCAKCPFRPDGSGYAADHPDFENIKQSVEMGLPFYCHETVLFDPRTKFEVGSEVEPVPNQPHFLGCRGAHEHRMRTWEERALAHLASRKKGRV